jgi:hypothetical protein
VGGDGTVYGWGVTDVTPPLGMYHVAYVNSTLTSPKGRVANNGQVQAASSVREDLSLPFVPNDTGTYLVSSWHSGFCHVCNCWLFANCGSGTSANNAAYPTNFTEAGWGKQGCCTLEFTYTWGSSSGNKADLAACTMGEYVTSSLGTGTQNWPYPMVEQVTYPITTTDWAPTSGLESDYLLAPSSFYTPYSAASFTDTQIYRYKCPGVNNWNWVTLPGGPYTMTRSVSQNGVWQYKVSKADGSLTYNLP